MDPNSVKVTKRDAASRQLDAGIRLFFEGGDMLAVHTLAGAAFQLLADLGRISGVVSRLRSEEFLNAERIPELIRALNRTQNFLKHADQDPDTALEYVQESTIFLLFEAVELAGRVVASDSRERLGFRTWFVFSYPELFQPPYVETARAAAPAGMDLTDRDLWALWLKRG